MRIALAVLALGFFLSAAPTAAQHQSPGSDSDGASGPPRTVRPILEAIRLEGTPPTIDGLLDEAVWLTGAVANDFVQLEPEEGEPATERTVVRVLYGDKALYVAFRAYDSAPDEIVGQLTRRDVDSYSDRVHVIIDSYFDRRTAFHFGVNPVGVKMDLYRYDDTREDSNWDAVWEVATNIDEEGWTAEFRIPYSQLRFANDADQTWGIQFAREIARKRETTLWAPMSQSENRLVSMAGELRGLADLGSPRRMELLPYTMARVARAPGDEADPFYSPTDWLGTAGADVKYGITNNLTLDLTINPDFGQVEADPAQVNLTAFEIFFPEKRPFFVEGASIFNFGIGLGGGKRARWSPCPTTAWPGSRRTSVRGAVPSASSARSPIGSRRSPKTSCFAPAPTPAASTSGIASATTTTSSPGICWDLMFGAVKKPSPSLSAHRPAATRGPTPSIPTTIRPAHR